MPIRKRGRKPSGWPPGNRAAGTVPPEEDLPASAVGGTTAHRGVTITDPVHHRFSIEPGHDPGELHVVCEQVDPARWYGARRSLLVLSADALPDLIMALDAHRGPRPWPAAG